VLKTSAFFGDQIAVMSLTHSTTRQLKDEIKGVPVSTMHSFCLRQLNLLGDAPKRRIVDEWEQNNLVIPDMQMLARRSGMKVRKRLVQEFFRRLGAGFRDRQADQPQLTPVDRVLRDAWLYLHEFMRFRVFDELAYDFVGHLASGSTPQDCPKLILVDEYQDLTPSEVELLRILAKDHGTAIFACGDDRQSICSFRDADLSSLGDFCGTYGIERPCFLNESRRCPAAVCGFAESVAHQMPSPSCFPDRPPLQPLPGLPEGLVRIVTFGSTKSETKWVHSQIAKLLERGVDASEIMVISSQHLDVYLEFLNNASGADGTRIVYFDTREHDPFCSTRPFRSLYALCRLAADAEDQLAWRTLLSLWTNVGRKTLEQLITAHSTTLLPSIRLAADRLPNMQRFLETVQVAKDRLAVSRSLPEAWECAANWGGVASDGSSWSEFQRLPEIQELQQALDDGAEFKLQALENALLTAASAQRSEHQRGGMEIGVRTVHQAKGLQAKYVFLVEASEQAFSDDRPGEGIRRLYVAATRTRLVLTITLGLQVRQRGNRLSQILKVDRLQLHPALIQAARRSGIRPAYVSTE
jgi:superfamily I DNA/RNA helicase